MSAKNTDYKKVYKYLYDHITFRICSLEQKIISDDPIFKACEMEYKGTLSELYHLKDMMNLMKNTIKEE